MSSVLSGIGSLIGIGSGIRTLTGGGSGSSSLPGSMTYQPQHQGEADTAWQQFLQQLQQQQGVTNQAVQPALAQGLQQMLGLAPGMTQQYGDLSGLAQLYQQLLQNQAGVAGGAQQNLMGAGNQLWQTALDPQNALRNKLQQQVTDASRAGTSARGIGMSGEAAGIENQDVQNFLLNWQNQQLARQATGLQGMTGAYGEAGRQGQGVGQNLTGAMTFGGMSPQYLQAGASYPLTAASMYGQAQSPFLSQMIESMGAIDPYLGLGQRASSLGFGQQQAGLANLQYGLGNLANLFQPSQQSNIPSGWGGTAADPWYG